MSKDKTKKAPARKRKMPGAISTYTRLHGITIKWDTYADPWHLCAVVNRWRLCVWQDGIWEIRRDGMMRVNGKEAVCADAMLRAGEVFYGLTKDI